MANYKKELSPEEYALYLEERKARDRERRRLRYRLNKMGITGKTTDQNPAKAQAMADFEEDQKFEQAYDTAISEARDRADIERRTGGKTPEQILQDVDAHVAAIRKDYQDGMSVNNVYNRAITMAEKWANDMPQPDDRPDAKDIRKPRRSGPLADDPDNDDDDNDDDKPVKSDWNIGSYRRIARTMADTYKKNADQDQKDKRTADRNVCTTPVERATRIEAKLREWVSDVTQADITRIRQALNQWMVTGFTPEQIEVAIARAEANCELIADRCLHGSNRHLSTDTADMLRVTIDTAHLLSPYNLSLKTPKLLSEETQKYHTMQMLTMLMLPTTLLLSMLSKGIRWKRGSRRTTVTPVGFSRITLAREARAKQIGYKAYNEKLLSEVREMICDVLSFRHVTKPIIDNMQHEECLSDTNRYFFIDGQLTSISDARSRVVMEAANCVVPSVPVKSQAIINQLQKNVLGTMLGSMDTGYQLPSNGDCFVLRYKPVCFSPATSSWTYDIEEMMDVLRMVHYEVTSGAMGWLSEVRYLDGILYIRCDRAHTGYRCQGDMLRMGNNADPTACGRSLGLHLHMTRAYVDGSYQMPDAIVLWNLDINNLREFEQSKYMQLCREEMQRQQQAEADRAERYRQMLLRNQQNKQPTQTE